MLTGCQIWHTIFMRKKNNEIGKNFLSGDSVKVGRSEKEVIWFPEKLRRVVQYDWPREVRNDAGLELVRVRRGFAPLHFREMPSIGLGVREIKLQDENKSQYRLIFIAKFEEGIYVFHLITKKTSQRTNKLDIELSKRRYREILKQRTENRSK